MISFLIKHKKSILVITLAFFIGSIVYIGLDAYKRSNNGLVAAMVGSEPISYRDLYRAREQQATLYRNKGIDVDEQMIKVLDQQILSALISEEILNQAALKAGLRVADYEIAYDIKTSPMFAPNGTFDKDMYERLLKYQVQMTPGEFEEQLRRGKLANRFRSALYSVYKLTPAEMQYSYAVEHGNSKNFDADKTDFAAQLMDTKMATAQQGFFDKFNKDVKIKTFLED